MGQKTAKTILEVLEWVESTRHHIVSAIKKPGHISLTGYGRDILFIPDALAKDAFPYLKPGAFFDSRMYRANPRGVRYMRRHATDASRTIP